MGTSLLKKAAFVVVISVAVLNPLVSATAQAATICTPSQVVITSTTETTVDVGTSIATYQSPLWQPAFQDAQWIWNSYLVVDPSVQETRLFTETFTLASAVSSTTLNVSADDYYKVIVNGTEFANETGDGNFFPANVHTYNIASLLNAGSNTVKFELTNLAHNTAVHGTAATPQNNPAGIMYRLVIDDSICITTSSGGGGGGGGGNHSSGSVSVAPVSNATPANNASNVSTTIAADTTVSGDTTNSNPAPTPAPEAVVAGEETNNIVAAVATTGFDFSTKCLLIGLLLAVLMWVIWKAMVRRIVEKYSNFSLRRSEITFYALASVATIFVLWYYAYDCVLPMFVLGALILMLVRGIRS